MEYISANSKWRVVDFLEDEKPEKVVVIFNPPHDQIFLLNEKYIKVIDQHYIYHDVERMFNQDIFRNRYFCYDHQCHINKTVGGAVFCPVVAATFSEALSMKKIELDPKAISLITTMGVFREIFWIDVSEKQALKWYDSNEKIEKLKRIPFEEDQITPKHIYGWAFGKPIHKIAYVMSDCGPFDYDRNFNPEIFEETLPKEVSEVEVKSFLYFMNDADSLKIKEVKQTTVKWFLTPDGEKVSTNRTETLTPNISILLEKESIFEDFLNIEKEEGTLVIDERVPEFLKVSLIWGKGIMVQTPLNPKKVDNSNYGDSGEDMFFYGGTYSYTSDEYSEPREITDSEFSNNIIELNKAFRTGDIIKRARIYAKYSSYEEYKNALDSAFEDCIAEHNAIADKIMSE